VAGKAPLLQAATGKELKGLERELKAINNSRSCNWERIERTTLGPSTPTPGSAGCNWERIEREDPAAEHPVVAATAATEKELKVGPSGWRDPSLREARSLAATGKELKVGTPMRSAHLKYCCNWERIERRSERRLPCGEGVRCNWERIERLALSRAVPIPLPAALQLGKN